MRSIYTSRQWNEDVGSVTAVVPELDSLAGKTVVVTGPTGLICSAVMDILINYNESHSKPVRLVAAGRSDQRVRERFAQYSDRDYFTFLQYDATSAITCPGLHADYIIHGAGNADPDMIMKEPVETMTGNFMGLKNWFDFAGKNGTTRILYISSSEVYGKKDDNRPFREDEYGYIDLLSPRSSYPVAKRAAETLCASYSHEYGVDAVIVRPGHIYGPTASPRDSRVSSAWAYAVARGEDIVMKSTGSQIRSYCHCLDTATAILKVLLCGESVRAYNISNPESVISIKTMAEILAEAGNVALRQELPTDKERKGFNPMSNSSLDASGLLSLGWKGCFDAATGFGHTVRTIRDMIG